MMTATAAVYWLWGLASGRPVLPAQIPPEAWFGLVGVGVVSTFIAIQAFYAGTQRIGAAQASIISTVEPIWTIVLALPAVRLRPDARPAGRRRADPRRRAARPDRAERRAGRRRPQVRLADE